MCIHVSLQNAVSDQQKANLLSIRKWWSKLAADAKKERPSAPKDPALLKKQDKWLDAPDLFKAVKGFLNEGELPACASGVSY